MFFHNIIRGRLSALLRPWLQAQPEPDLELKVGLIDSRATLRNLRFDASVLNHILVDDDSIRFFFHEFTVEHLEIRFSTWSAPAFSIEVRGVHVTLSARAMEEGGSRRARSSRDRAAMERKKALSSIDPEGSSLHDVLERILVSASRQSQLKTSLVNLILSHCRVRMLGVDIQVQLPTQDDSLAYFLKVREISSEPRNSGHGGLVRGFLGALLLPLNESLFTVSGYGIDIGYKRNDRIGNFCVSDGMFIGIKLYDLQLVDLSVRILDLSFLFCPADLPVFLALGKLSSKEYKNSRNGRQLWRVAAGRIGLVISSPVLSLQNLVGFVILWLQYVNAYEYLLVLIGYSSNKLQKRSITNVSKKKMLLTTAKYKWEMICNIEKELPAEAVAQARRVARYRARLNVQQSDDSNEDSFLGRHFYYLCKILCFLAYICMAMCKTFQSAACFLFSRKILNQGPEVVMHNGADSGCLFQEFQSMINLGKVSITIYLENSAYPIIKKLETRIGLSLSDFLSLHFSVDEFLLMYVATDAFEQSLSISCGQLMVESSNFGQTPVKSSFEDVIGSVEGHKKWRGNNLKNILYVEPARSALHSIIDNGHDDDQNEGPRHLENFLREMWANWKRDCMELDENEIERSENPCFLCEIKNVLARHDPNNQTSGSWKCNMLVGKLNIALGYSSLASIVLLYWLIQWAHQQATNNGSSRFRSCSRRENENQQEIGCDEKYEFYTSKMKGALHRIPEKHIQVGIFVAGPCVQISMEKSMNDNHVNNITRQKDLQLIFDLHNIEFVVWPTSRSDIAALKPFPRSDDAESDWSWIQELQIIDIPKPYNEKYTSQGWISLCCYLKFRGVIASICDVAENQRSQIFVLKPITFCLSSLREYVYSFSEAVTAFSTALNGLALGVSIVSEMDGMSIFFQLLFALSHAFSDFQSLGNLPGQEWTICKLIPVEHESEETLVGRNLLFPLKTHFIVKANIKLKSVDVILQVSRPNKKGENFLEFPKIAHQDVSDSAIWSSVVQTCFEVSYEEKRLQLHVDLSEFESMLFSYQDNILKSFDHSISRDSLVKSHNCFSEVSLSGCVFTICLGYSGNMSTSGNENNTLGDSSPCTVANLFTADESGTSSVDSHRSAEQLVIASNCPVLNTTQWIHVNLAFGDLLVVRHSTKHVLVGAHQSTKFLSSLSVVRKFQSVSLGIQGGTILVEPMVLVMIIQGFSSYGNCIMSMSSVVESSGAEKAEGNMRISEFDSQMNHGEGTPLPSQQVKWELLEAFSADLSHFTIGFIGEEKSGELRELVLEIDHHISLELENMQWKLVYELSCLSIFSQILAKLDDEPDVPNFSWLTSNGSSQAFQYMESIGSVEDASVSRGFDSRASTVNNHVPQGFCSDNKNYILKHLSVLVSVNKPENFPPQLNQAWFGSGSISGFDITISLSELQMILSMLSSLSGLSKQETTNGLPQRHWSSDNETDKSFEAMVPDGAIVAIQDVHQHLYFTVEDGRNKYALGGVLHYSLVGDRSLFRVKHYKQRMWRSSVLWFSLTSLYAKNNQGEPLQLNYQPGSCLVDISGTCDNAPTLWQTISCESESYKGEIDWEPYRRLVKDVFFLVNKKSDSAVAFIDGLPEFVRKPGNPFKFKVFHDYSMVHSATTISRYSLDSSAMPVHPEARQEEERTSVKIGSVPCINITVDQAALTIVHEFTETKDRSPLLRGSININQLTVQILTTKARVVSTAKASVLYFDAQRNLWREFIQPVEVSAFYRSTFQTQCSENALHRIPVHIYCRTGRWEISLTEMSLDILLFVIGKLDLAGPFSVKSSAILANRCKVKNHSGLNLLCHFNEKKTVAIGRKQSASVFLRHPASANQTPEASPVLSIQLSVGNYITSSIHFSLLEARKLAWRTRIMSLQDSRSYPGPFIVVNVSKRFEDGLSVSVSPLIRIHNETELSMELRFRRPEQKQEEFAILMLKPGDTIDDSMAAFDAINLSGGQKKALTSLTVGNFLFSFRPEKPENLSTPERQFAVEWSEELKGGKAVRLSGVFDKLSFGVRRAFSIEPVKCSFSTACCDLKSEVASMGKMHFLIQSISRDVPITKPDMSSEGLESRNSPIALQEQKEIFLLPTVRVSSLLHLEAVILLTETDQDVSESGDNTGKQTPMQFGSTVDFYVDPAIIYFSVRLTAFETRCKPVNSGEWVKKLQKFKNDVECLDVDLHFAGGKYHASLRLSRGERGILEAAIFTSYTLKNDSDHALFFFAPNQKPLSREDLQKYDHSIPPELGLYLPTKSKGSWFMRSHKVRVKLVEGRGASEALLDLSALSGLTEISLETEDESAVQYIMKFGLSVKSASDEMLVPSQVVTFVPRHVVVNESKETIMVRQCYLEDDTAGIIFLKNGQRAVLQLRNGFSKRREFCLFENFIRKHGNDYANALMFIQFQLNEPKWSWSGPLCITSIGHFFLKFRKQSDESNETEKSAFASVTVAEEGPTLTVHFQKPPTTHLPYRIENCLHAASLTYYQKDSSVLEVLGAGCKADYCWDDLTLPHKLVVLINGMHPLREVSLDMVHPWKSFFKTTQHIGLSTHSLLEKTSKDQRSTFGDYSNIEMVKVGYEVYAEGLTRVLRISESSESHRGDATSRSSAKIQFRVSRLAISLLEDGKQNSEDTPVLSFMPILVARMENIDLDSIFTEQQKYNQICIQLLSMEQKWAGAPFAAMLRRHESDSTDPNDCLFKFVFVVLSSGSSVKQVKYSSILLQPIDLNLDEETLMRIVPFWRTSLSTNSQSSQYYFDHFEIQPIKIIANFLPGDSYSSYNSAQETLRSLLHSVVKVPPIKNMVVELNGVLVTHALITVHELVIRCARHYSWYAIRAIYIAKGSPLLPPAFASIFDDLASSSLDAFFDPSRGVVNLPGLTLGTFKLLSKCIDSEGLSGTRRYFGDLGKTLRTAGSNVIFAAITEISDSVLKGAEMKGFDGLVSGFHQGVLKLAMEPSLLGTALMEGGPDRTIKLDRTPGVDELYIEGYLQAMLDTIYRQEYLRVKVIDDQVFLKNLPPNNSLIDEIMDRVKGFLVSRGLLKGDPSTSSRPPLHLQEREWKIGPTVLTLCEHLFVSYAIRILRKQAGKFISRVKPKELEGGDDTKAIIPAKRIKEDQKVRFVWRLGIGKFLLSGIIAYIDGRLCRCIPNPIARRIVSGFLLSFLDQSDEK